MIRYRVTTLCHGPMGSPVTTKFETSNFERAMNAMAPNSEFEAFDDGEEPEASDGE